MTGVADQCELATVYGFTSEIVQNEGRDGACPSTCSQRLCMLQGMSVARLEMSVMVWKPSHQIPVEIEEIE